MCHTSQLHRPCEALESVMNAQLILPRYSMKIKESGISVGMLGGRDILPEWRRLGR